MNTTTTTTTAIHITAMPAEFIAASEAYCNARRALRETGIAAIASLIPEGVEAAVLEMDISELDELLCFVGFLIEGVEVDPVDYDAQHGTTYYDTIDRIARDMEYTDYDTAKIDLIRTADLTQFLIHRATN